MARVRERDAGAFEALYDSYHRLVYGIAARILHDEMAAEDVTQSVFLKLWSAPDAFQGGNFGAWLARVSRNRALDVLRSRALREEGEISPTFRSTPFSTSSSYRGSTAPAFVKP